MRPALHSGVVDIRSLFLTTSAAHTIYDSRTAPAPTLVVMLRIVRAPLHMSRAAAATLTNGATSSGLKPSALACSFELAHLVSWMNAHSFKFIQCAIEKNQLRKISVCLLAQGRRRSNRTLLAQQQYKSCSLYAF